MWGFCSSSICVCIDNGGWFVFVTHHSVFRSQYIISVSDIYPVIFISFPPKYLDGRSKPSWFMEMKVLCLPSEWVAMKAFNNKFLYNSCTFKRLSGRQVGDDLLIPLFMLQEMVLLDGSNLVTCFERTKSALLWNHPRIIQSKNAPLINLKSDIFKRSLISSDDT